MYPPNTGQAKVAFILHTLVSALHAPSKATKGILCSGEQLPTDVAVAISPTTMPKSFCGLKTQVSQEPPIKHVSLAQELRS